MYIYSTYICWYAFFTGAITFVKKTLKNHPQLHQPISFPPKSISSVEEKCKSLEVKIFGLTFFHMFGCLEPLKASQHVPINTHTPIECETQFKWCAAVNSSDPHSKWCSVWLNGHSQALMASGGLSMRGSCLSNALSPLCEVHCEFGSIHPFTNPCVY